MPGYKGHIIGAIVFYCAVVVLLVAYGKTVSGGLASFACVILGGLFPDVDTKSKGQKIFYMILVGTIVFLLMMGAYHLLAVLVTLGLVPLLVGHRGIFHNFWFIALLTALVLFFVYCCVPCCSHGIVRNGGFFLLGVFSHLVLDFGFARALRLRLQ